MITYKVGNLLDVDCDVIAHQTNCFGVMGGGVALQIRQRYPQVYEQYKHKCESIMNEKHLLGTVYSVQCGDKIIANMFSQYSFGRGTHTQYDKFEQCVQQLLAEYPDKIIAMPYKIGCGLAGGDWLLISQILEKYFSDKGNLLVVSLTNEIEEDEFFQDLMEHDDWLKRSLKDASGWWGKLFHHN